jgi:anaerobilin synthase
MTQNETTKFPFDSRLRSHMETYRWSGCSPTGNEKKLWEQIHQEGSSSQRRRTAYIHIPFCGTLCSFCNFQRSAGTPATAERYSLSLIKELEWYSSSKYVQQGGFEALYLGGGTPSLLSTTAISELIVTARRALSLDHNAEITVESTIHDLSEKKLEAMKKAGVNRISLGVQTFETDRRRMLGRLSDKDRICRTVEQVRSAGIETISCDILYRLPGANTTDFLNDINLASELGFDGVSVYPLIVMESTPLEKSVKAGEFESMPPLTEEILQYLTGRRMLLDLGYRQDTCTHFVRNSDRNLYASVRLDNGDCLPLGSGAGGYLENLILMNAVNPQMYKSLISSGKPGYMAAVELSPRAMTLRDAAGMIQKGFFDLRKFDISTEEDLMCCLTHKIESFAQKGLLEKREDVYRLTENGWTWCYNMAAEISTEPATVDNDKHQNRGSAGWPVGTTPPHPHQLKYGSAAKTRMHGFTVKEISTLGVLCALVVVVNFMTAMTLHVLGAAVIPGVMQFAMGFTSSLILYTALKKVPKAGALSIISAVYSFVTMLLSGSILMSFGLVIGGVSGDIFAKFAGGIQRGSAILGALFIYRICQTSFSSLYAYITGTTQVKLVWYLIAISIAASGLGAIAGAAAGIKLFGNLKRAGVMNC